MSSVIEICNLALSQVRAVSINSLEESSAQAQFCALHYPTVRDQVLKDFDWGFNNTTKALQLLSVKVFGWGYAWVYPNDCMQINRIYRSVDDVSPNQGLAAARYDYRLRRPALNRVEYKVAQINDARVIATNETDLYIEYRARIEDVNQYGPNVRMAIAYLLAANISISLAGIKDGRALRTDNLALYNAFKTEAQAGSAEERNTTAADSEFITIREG